MTVKTVDISRSHAIMGIALFAALGVSGWQFYTNDQRKGKEELKTNLTEQEIRLLQQELATERAKNAELMTQPKYEDGFRDALLRRGGPQNPGSYQDGYEAAVKLMNNRSYADGYHNAIQQFGYQTKGEEVVPKPSPEPKK
jgi:hypothetical protein